MHSNDSSEAASHLTWRTAVLFLITLLGVVLCCLIASPFVPALTWSVALAVATYKPYRWLAKKVHHRSLTALLGTLLVILLIVGPIILLVESLGQQFFRLVTLVQSGAAQDWATSMLQQHQWMQRVVDHISSTVNVKQGSQAAAGFLAGKLQGLLAGSLRTITQMAIMLYTLFFLLRDGDQARSALRSVLPLRRTQADHLLHRMSDSISATILGSLGIAAIQGTLGGIIFAILGVPNAVIWAFLMGVMATIPSLGTFLVWAPVAGYLALTGHLVKATVLVAFGMGVISTVDNLLYPTLVSKRLQMPTLATFFAVLGGVAIFGVSGLVLGPLVLVSTVTLLRFWNPDLLTPKSS